MGKIKQVTQAQLMEDPVYRKWFTTPPREFELSKWRVYVKPTKKSGWAKRDFVTWKKASKFVAKNSGRWYDVVLCCINDQYRPPVISVQVGKKWKRQYYAPMVDMEGHTWCTRCRRPTVFGWYTAHHAFTNHFKPLPYKKRCGVCGVSQAAIKQYNV